MNAEDAMSERVEAIRARHVKVECDTYIYVDDTETTHITYCNVCLGVHTWPCETYEVITAYDALRAHLEELYAALRLPTESAVPEGYVERAKILRMEWDAAVETVKTRSLKAKLQQAEARERAIREKAKALMAAKGSYEAQVDPRVQREYEAAYKFIQALAGESEEQS